MLAGSIEAAAGEASAARALFTRAYSLNRADKQLYMAWPKLEGEAGNVERARLLFQAGLALHPSNIKILNLYACFEEGQGNVALARELHTRALGIDGASKTSMHNRVSWADLELRDGHPGRARALLAEGLDTHPDFAAALLLMAQVERRDGDLDLAEAYARRAQKVRRCGCCCGCWRCGGWRRWPRACVHAYTHAVHGRAMAARCWHSDPRAPCCASLPAAGEPLVQQRGDA